MNMEGQFYDYGAVILMTILVSCNFHMLVTQYTFLWTKSINNWTSRNVKITISFDVHDRLLLGPIAMPLFICSIKIMQIHNFRPSIDLITHFTSAIVFPYSCLLQRVTIIVQLIRWNFHCIFDYSSIRCEAFSKSPNCLQGNDPSFCWGSSKQHCLKGWNSWS